MKANKLSVNIKKTNYVVFKSKQKRINTDLSLSFNGQVLKKEHVVKFLGVNYDENLSWTEHITYICKKISKSVGIIYRSRFCLSTNTKLMLFYTIIYPYLTYCNIAWVSTYPTNLNSLLLMQKRAVRAITNACYGAHTKPLFSQLKLLDIYQINIFYSAKFMFPYHNHLLPSSFHMIFNTGSQMHIYNTRADYRTHACRTNIEQFTILFQGPKLWNHYQKILSTKLLLVVSGTEC
jgi:hypothetical protein